MKLQHHPRAVSLTTKDLNPSQISNGINPRASGISSTTTSTTSTTTCYIVLAISSLLLFTLLAFMMTCIIHRLRRPNSTTTAAITKQSSLKLQPSTITTSPSTPPATEKKNLGSPKSPGSSRSASTFTPSPSTAERGTPLSVRPARVAGLSSAAVVAASATSLSIPPPIYTGATPLTTPPRNGNTFPASMSLLISPITEAREPPSDSDAYFRAKRGSVLAVLRHPSTIFRSTRLEHSGRADQLLRPSTSRGLPSPISASPFASGGVLNTLPPRTSSRQGWRSDLDPYHQKAGSTHQTTTNPNRRLHTAPQTIQEPLDAIDVTELNPNGSWDLEGNWVALFPNQYEVLPLPGPISPLSPSSPYLPSSPPGGISSSPPGSAGSADSVGSARSVGSLYSSPSRPSSFASPSITGAVFPLPPGMSSPILPNCRQQKQQLLQEYSASFSHYFHSDHGMGEERRDVATRMQNARPETRDGRPRTSSNHCRTMRNGNPETGNSLVTKSQTRPRPHPRSGTNASTSTSNPANTNKRVTMFCKRESQKVGRMGGAVEDVRRGTFGQRLGGF